jgi:iron(III) transport system substrate-binding protein
MGLMLTAGHAQQAARPTEGEVRVYAALDAALAGDLIKDFQTLYPKIKVDYVDQSTTELYNRAISEAAAGTGSADLLLSSAMDLQFKLVEDGYTAPYQSPELANVSPWAVYKDLAFGVTQEPLVIVYNKRLMPEGDVPKTRDELVKLLNTKSNEYKGKVATIDPERIGTGFLFFTQDLKQTEKTWDVAKALGKSEVKLYTSTGAMLERVSSGEHLLAYNIIGSYALERAKADPSIGVVFPSDYVSTVSRIVVIPKNAPHLETAKVFLDYLLSQRGQKILAARSFGTVRKDAKEGSAIPASLASVTKPVEVNPDLLTYLDPAKRLRFLKQWQASLQGK